MMPQNFYTFKIVAPVTATLQFVRTPLSQKYQTHYPFSQRIGHCGANRFCDQLN